MKKYLAMLLAVVMVLSLAACGGKTEAPATTAAPAPDAPAATEATEAPKSESKYPSYFDGMDDLIAAAQAEGELTVYGSCEEEYLAAACQHFQEVFGIKVNYQRLSTGEVQAKIEEEKGNPSADVWFGGTTDPYNVVAKEGLLEPYAAQNASHLLSDMYKDPDGNWYGIYKGILGFMVNTDELARMNLEAPADWQDLLKPEYKGLVWLSNYNTAGTAKLVINTMIQKYGHDEGIQYLVDLDKNIEVYTKSGSGPSKNVGTGECVIGIGFLHDGMARITDDNCTGLRLIAPASGAPQKVDAAAIFQDAAHPSAAKLWTEYALSPECVDLAAQNGCYQYPVIDNAASVSLPAVIGLSSAPLLLPEDDGSEADTWVDELMAALTEAGADTGADRFLTD